MQHGASAYSKVAQVAQSPRELEAAILMKAAARLQAIRDDWAGRKGDLDEALTYNRKLWTILVTSATEASNPLPHAIKQNAANLGLFVFNQTVSVMTNPAPERLASLITINREIAAGLRASVQANAA